VIEQDLVLALVIPIRYLEEQVPGLDLVQRPSRPLAHVGDDDLAAALLRDLDHQRHRADVDALAVGDRDLALRRDALAAHVGAVGAAAVLDEDLAAFLDQHGVTARHLRVVQHDVVVGRSSDGLKRLAEVEVADHRVVLARALPPCRRGRDRSRRRGVDRRCRDRRSRTCGLRLRRRQRMRHLHQSLHRYGHRTERHHAVRIEGSRLVRRQLPLPRVRSARRPLVGHHHAVEHQRRVAARDRRVTDDERSLGRLPSHDDVTRRGPGAHRAALHQHQADGRVVEGHVGLAAGEHGPQVEGHRAPRRHRLPACEARARSIVREYELAASLMDDARVLGCNTGPLQHDVAMRGASDEDRLLAKAWNH